MKKFGLLLGVFLILTGLTFWDNGLTDIYERTPGARVCFYVTADESLNLGGFSQDVLIIRSGAGIIIEAPGAAAAELRQGFSKIRGESVSFCGNYADAQEIIRFYRVQTVKKEILPSGNTGKSITIIYGFSKLLTKSVNLDGEKVNIQIAVNGATGRVTAGTPLILGSY